MRNIPPVHSHHGAAGLLPARHFATNSVVNARPTIGPSFSPSPDHASFPRRYLKWLSWFRERRTRLSRSRRGRRRYRGVFFKGKSLYVRGASGHIYDHRFLRTKHRAKIRQLSYSL